MSVFKFQGSFQTRVNEYRTVDPDGTERTVREEWQVPDQFILGIPARDMTEEDWAQLTPEQQQQALDSGLYKQSGPRRAAKFDSAPDVTNVEEEVSGHADD